MIYKKLVYTQTQKKTQEQHANKKQPWCFLRPALAAWGRGAT